MSLKTSVTLPAVSPAEVQHRVELYRQEGLKHQATPHAVYRPPFLLCPWPGCGYRISAISFQIEQNPAGNLYLSVIAAWWQGPGIVGRCPGCGRLVLFSTTEKLPIDEPVPADLVVLPDDWHQHAYIVP